MNARDIPSALAAIGHEFTRDPILSQFEAMSRDEVLQWFAEHGAALGKHCELEPEFDAVMLNLSADCKFWLSESKVAAAITERERERVKYERR